MPEFALPLETPETTPAELSAAELIQEHFAFVWRLFRRLGLPAADADDATQQVFMVACGKLERIQPGSARSFLYGCALHHVSKWRTLQRRSPLALEVANAVPDERADAEEDLDKRRARELLDRVLAELPEELRTIFVLYEIEQLSSFEIASLLDLPRGTVASRLHRARDQFERKVARAQLQRNLP